VQRERGRIMQECAGSEPGVMMSLAPCTKDQALEILSQAARTAQEQGFHVHGRMMRW
jgi:hypothetical protein